MRLPITTLIIFLICSGCTVAPVAPWDWDLLAQESMQFVPDRIAAGIDEHIYTSREATSGGAAIGGGGCGCN